ncbi:hypothetical protein M2451_002454 [Dysgonomonas sp. PFB1-18]|uniref:hypothetical protein n=1 Tax=unclassified Dysgonomonas TaxID=2630389 RepID=UPI002473D8B7|nr:MULTISPECIES: hypothetical protein [unclassified Dysgonomonas]MDL2303545.1 hypothetical protein [Dysgonomonas sp. OttesenSCG-928-D17]MDH6307221.1 hypothetical protein [Dysgonomonas sp. PF1-14]MDH6337139.1 hypothetical protein [Dysgonomonas sp. PF1-16]MDH6381125.1 hypothetical protein [Dysgonomonas sp. PFB1-18]MDH6396295.1 hypothetical protein [Dysgonomonas sp. PF1-23]
MKTNFNLKISVKFLLLTLISFSLLGCSGDDDSPDIVWNSKDLSQTIWEGTINIDGKEEKILLSFDSEQEGYCYSNREENLSCLFEYSIVDREIRFYNIYGDSDKLIVDGLWHFTISTKKNIQLQKIISAEKSDYLTLYKK